MTIFCQDESAIEPLEVPNINRFKTSTTRFDLENVFGRLETGLADFNSRYQPTLCKETLESAKLSQTIEIDLKRVANCSGFSIGRDKIIVCYWDACVLAIYGVDGMLVTELDMFDKLRKQPTAASFIDDSEVAIACRDGLIIVDIQASAVIRQKLHSDHVTDVFYHEQQQRLYALNKTKSSIDSFN